MATAAGASCNIQQASLEELQPEYGPGNLRAPFGDKVGVKLLSRVPQDVVTGQGSRLENCTSWATLQHVPSSYHATKYGCSNVASRRFEHALMLRPPTLRTTPSEA